MNEKFGGYAFLVGVLIAILAGIFAPGNNIAALVLVILGLIVGFLNITDREIHGFLMASVALILTGFGNWQDLIPVVGMYIHNIVQYVVIFVAPAAFIVALMEIKRLAENK
ncbi:hypothetical protein HYS48_03280 [Candidatus Woesearchaeota archaeon]|nr:hypothetical protein [Candidatus Woesearchaeota archaeon]